MRPFGPRSRGPNWRYNAPLLVAPYFFALWMPITVAGTKNLLWLRSGVVVPPKYRICVCFGDCADRNNDHRLRTFAHLGKLSKLLTSSPPSELTTPDLLTSVRRMLVWQLYLNLNQGSAKGSAILLAGGWWLRWA